MPKKTKTPNYKTEWDLSLIYKSGKDPRIDQDLKQAEVAFQAFADKYEGKTDYLVNETKLAESLADYEALQNLAIGKAYLYFHYRTDLNSKDTEAQSKSNLFQDRLAKIENKITFYTISLGRITPANQAKFLKSKKLAPYAYFLETIFKTAKYILSDKEEKLINLKYLPAHSLWVKATDKLIAGQQIKWKGKTLSVTEAMERYSALPTNSRRALWRMIMEKFQEISEVAEAELNAVVINKKIDDELRGLSEPHQGTVISYQNDMETVEKLSQAVKKHARIAHRFYRTKAKMLGLTALEYADRAAQITSSKKQFKFDDAVTLVSAAFSKINPIYSELLSSMLANGQIDVHPRAGKTGGAYCSSYEKLPIYVLLNHADHFQAVTTLAHEMGHAIHSKFSTDNQPPLYRDYTTATAEVASTFFENAVFDELLPTLSPKEQIVALHDKIQGSIQTIFRQMACFNFELDLHNQVRAKGSLAKEQIAELMNKHMAAYLGPIFKLKPDDGYFFVTWSHIRRFFYVYTYAFGEIVSSALYQMYKEDPSVEEKLRQFLSAGGSASPEDIFQSIGINVRDPKFFEIGLKKIEADIIKLEKLIK